MSAGAGEAGGAMNQRLKRLESMQHNGPATQQRPGPGNRRLDPDARETLLSPEALAYAARVRAAEREAVKDKAYRGTPIGGEAGRFLRALRWSDKAQNTLDTYEIVLAKLSYDFAHLELQQLTPELLRDFLDDHWGEAAPETRRNRLAILRSFFNWAVDEDRLTVNPVAKFKPPRRRITERQAYPRDVIQKLIAAQPTLRDQVALRLLGQLGLRKNELRVLKVGDIDLQRGHITVHGKGDKIVVMPLAFRELAEEAYLHISGEGRAPDEYLLYPKRARTRPMDPAALHRWFKRCLERAGLPDSVKLHELRHSAADEIWRVTGDIVMAQKLLRHESVGTTQAYLHPRREDLADAMRSVDDAWQEQAVRSPDGRKTL